MIGWIVTILVILLIIWLIIAAQIYGEDAVPITEWQWKDLTLIAKLASITIWIFFGLLISIFLWCAHFLIWEWWH